MAVPPVFDFFKGVRGGASQSVTSAGKELPGKSGKREEYFGVGVIRAKSREKRIEKRRNYWGKAWMCLARVR